jgi:hypothetical protein
MENIKQFKFYSSVWLGYLFEKFPEPIDIDVRWVEGKKFKGERKFMSYMNVIKSWDQYSCVNKDSPVEKEFWISHATLKFLIQEGYVRTNNEERLEGRHFEFTECALTEKGLSKMMSTSFFDHRSLGERLIELLREGKYSQILRLIKFE